MRWPWSKTPKHKPTEEAPLAGFETLAAGGDAAAAGGIVGVLRRLDAGLHKYPLLAKPIDYTTATWRKLVDAFCETIDPLLARAFPDLRLTAVVGADGEIALHRATKQGVQGLGTLAALPQDRRDTLVATKWSTVELRLPPAQVLRRTLSLPAASGEFIGPIISHRLERLTPWRPDNVLYGYRIDDATAGDMMSVALLAVSKDALTGPLGRLHEAGVKPNAIGVDEGTIAAPLQLVLRQDGTLAARLDSRKTVSRVALAALACLGVVYGVTAVFASSATDAEQESAAKLMKGRRLLRGAGGENGLGRERVLLNAKTANTAMVVLVDKLAGAIPEDTYLKELSVAPDKVRFVGSSVNAPALVGKLEAIGLYNVRFTSAITRGKDQRDSFEITADRAAVSPDKVDQ